ncbi:MAG: diaminopimelate epimerase [Propionibacteriales bacterium]|nr:diaminopimelate epimerase [Propionibacteriales bacterium]
MSFPFVKGHGTRNDFIVLPDLDGSVHGELASSVVSALCDRRGGIGADGVLRVMAVDGGWVGDDGGSGGREKGDPQWFMDYRNADGSMAQMCGNGVRVFARYLQSAGLVDPSRPLTVDTRDGVKTVTFCDDGEISVEMGTAVLGRGVKVTVEGRSHAARAVDLGNPHAVAIVDSLSVAGDLSTAPDVEEADFPHGVNIEFVELRGGDEVVMRVFERGVGETASCGTGACAAVAAVAAHRGQSAPATYTVHVPGGVLTVTTIADGALHLKGPAVLVASGTWKT